MAKLFQNKYRIKSARCCNWDYGSNAIYFITICTASRVQYFGRIMNNEMILSDAGKIVKKFWLEIPDHFEFVELDEFVIMPDHIHGLIIINKNKNHQAYCKNNENVANGNNFTDIIETRQCLVSMGNQMNMNHQMNMDDKINLHNKIKTINKNQKSIGSERFRNPGKNNLSSIIGSFKSVCTKQIHVQFPKMHFAWQSRFHDHIVRNDNEYMRIKHYIILNPKNWHIK